MDNLYSDEEQHQCMFLSNSGIRKLEDFLISRNLKLTKENVSKAARCLNLSIKHSLAYFEALKEEINQEGIEKNEDLLNELTKVYKKIRRLDRKVKR